MIRSSHVFWVPTSNFQPLSCNRARRENLFGLRGKTSHTVQTVSIKAISHHSHFISLPKNPNHSNITLPTSICKDVHHGHDHDQSQRIHLQPHHAPSQRPPKIPCLL